MKLEFILGAIVAFLGIAIGSYFYGRHDEKNAQIAHYVALKKKYDDQGEKLAQAALQAKEKQAIIYRTKTKVIRETVDPTQCADTPVPAAILQQLQ